MPKFRKSLLAICISEYIIYGEFYKVDPILVGNNFAEMWNAQN
jgi:hypothetical protein